MSNTVLQIVINAIDNATGSISKIGSSIKSMEDQFNQVGKAATIVGGGIVAALGFSMKAAADSDEAWAKVGQQIRLSGLDFDKTKRSIEEFSSKTQRLTGISDEYSSKIVGLMLPTVKDVTKATELASLALDIETSGKMNAEAATRVLSLAYLGEVDALKRLVPDLKLVSDETLKHMSQSERSAMAIEALKGQFGGLAEAVGKTPTGQLKILNETLGDLGEKIGNVLNPHLTKLVNNHLLPLLDRLSDWMDKNPKLTEQIIIVAAALGGFLVVVGPLLIILPGLIAAIGLLLSPIGLVILAITALIAIGVALYMNWDIISQKAVQIWTKIKDFFYQTFDGIRIIITEKWNAIKQYFFDVWEGIKDIFKKAIDWINEKLQPLFNALDKLKGGINAVGGAIGSGFSSAKNFLGVNDGVIQNGQIITTHPDDFIIATKNPGSLGGNNAGSSVVVNVYGDISGNELVQKVEEAIMSKLSLNGKYSF